MFSPICLFASFIILFLVFRFRVHIHVTYTPTISRSTSVARKGRRAARTVGADASTATTRPIKFVPVASNQPERSGPIACQPTERAARIPDIQSALVNLGAAKKASREAAVQAVLEHPDASFDVQFSVALQGVRNVA
jgi:hypothetical protein